MEELNSLNLKYEVVCKRLNPGKMMCISSKCKNSAPCCIIQECQVCNLAHKKCKVIRTQYFINKIVAKKQSITQEILEGIKVMEKAYDDAIDRLSKDKEFITSQFDMFGYNQAEVQFMTLLKDGLAEEITGTLNARILQTQGIKRQWVATAETIQKYWNRKQVLFTEIFDKFKNVVKIGIPSFESKITDQIDLIMEFLGEDFNIQEIKLLYRASQQGYQVQKFHSLCDGKRHTLVLAKTQFGRVIGGYTPLPWTSNHQYGQDLKRESFIFSITNKQKYSCIQPQYGNYGGQNYGPTFGGGHDFYIANNSNTQTTSYFNFPYSYNNGKMVNGQQSYLSFSGATNSYNARVVEWQVFHITLL